MNAYRWLALLGLLLLTACAGSFREPALSPQHPASPQTAQASWKDPSPTLEQEVQDENRSGRSAPPLNPPITGEHDRSTVEASSPAPSGTIYTCPMHPEVIRGEPGNCPKCGMRLVEKKVPK